MKGLQFVVLQFIYFFNFHLIYVYEWLYIKGYFQQKKCAAQSRLDKTGIHVYSKVRYKLNAKQPISALRHICTNPLFEIELFPAKLLNAKRCSTFCFPAFPAKKGGLLFVYVWSLPAIKAKGPPFWKGEVCVEERPNGTF